MLMCLRFNSERYENNFICSGLFFWFQNTPYIWKYSILDLSKLHLNMKTENEKIMILWIRAQNSYFEKNIFCLNDYEDLKVHLWNF